jgi:replicative superfamily II helicase
MNYLKKNVPLQKFYLKKNIMNRYIEELKFNALRNMEFNLLVTHILSIVDQPFVLNRVGKRVDTLKAFLPELEKIEAQDRKWHESNDLNQAEKDRDNYVNILIRTERTYSRIIIPEYETASKLLTSLFDKHKRDIATDTNIAETERIYNLVNEVEHTSALLEALKTFSLIPAYEAMKAANIRFDELWQKRNRELGEIEPIDTKTIRTECVKAIKNLYKGIEYWDDEEGTPEWDTLIRTLSQLGSYYKQPLKARATRRKNKDSAAPDDEPVIAPV